MSDLAGRAVSGANEEGRVMGTQEYVVYLVIGVVLVLADGQLLARSGRAYLTEFHADEPGARSANQLVVGLFHLVMLGLLALMSTVRIDVGSPAQNLVAKLGYTLLLLALVHGCVMVVLIRIRRRRREQLLAEEMATQVESGRKTPSRLVVEPAPEEAGRQPSVAPALDQDQRYRAG
ncbi:hypothetical protein F0L68_17100 [Solihabitans fulvus]|uniref:Uncharacterized protein n=1 Tax=Solihabitans fulvus TaxID=1892852 RepID=A0A5B2XDR8_9PSEU|nr:hypothetical protein [Solihabitans fulvus]KAA2261493.1 hypothetical protein F0L68_17100 [Solihabitans fulvus]